MDNSKKIDLAIAEIEKLISENDKLKKSNEVLIDIMRSTSGTLRDLAIDIGRGKEASELCHTLADSLYNYTID